jgi:hypothetical protein
MYKEVVNYFLVEVYKFSQKEEINKKEREVGLQPDQILFKNIQILTDTDIRIRIFSDTDIFLTDMDMNMVWNLEPDTDADTDNYPYPDVLKFRISMTLKYIYRWPKY